VVVECVAITPDRVRINVRDTGAGLPPDLLANLFQPFNRLGRERGAEQGTGIGLVMSKRLVELMGGVLGVESTEGVGSVCWCELGAAVARVLDTKPAKAADVDSVLAQPGAPMRTLLYVEDNPANLKLVEQLIARRPTMRLLTAVDGNIGIQVARANQPEMILMDINLPGISGPEALKIPRDDPATAHPVVALAPMMPRDTRGARGGVLLVSHRSTRSRSSWRRVDAGARVGACPCLRPRRFKATVLIADDHPPMPCSRRCWPGRVHGHLHARSPRRAACTKHCYDPSCSISRCPAWTVSRSWKRRSLSSNDGYLPVVVITAQPDHSSGRSPGRRTSSASRSMSPKYSCASTTCWKGA
jgi:CheY-like chemotaxis protein